MSLASQKVCDSQDLLPAILLNLKDPLGKQEETDSWRKELIPLLAVNRSFFDCAADMLWESMPTLEPVLKLLPWFSTPYNGIGDYHYSGADDWKVFNSYAKRVKSIQVRNATTVRMPTLWFIELLNLHGRPKPFFPSLKRVEITADASAELPVLFFLRGPAGNAWPLAVQIDQYHLPKPASLSLGAAYFEGEAAISANVPIAKGMLPTLTALQVMTTQYQHCLVAASLCPSNLENLGLRFVNPQDVTAVYICLALYLSCNPTLSKLKLEFRKGNLGSIPSVARDEWPSIYDATDRFLYALKNCRDVDSLTISEAPMALAKPAFPVILQGIREWKHLTALCITVELPASESRQERAGEPRTPTFPGLAFLAWNVWMYFPNMRSLESQFDRVLVEGEDLEKPLEACEAALKGHHTTTGKHPYPEGGHPLRTLRIRTGESVPGSSELHLNLSRKVQIATFINRLFPMLECVEGSASEVWREIDTWVKSYREQSERIFSQVDDILSHY
ncbi:hypothetical protein NMY22_g4416 [Coprinellus aureogranulatus]|nr:hypothetical protein NMY22_g4416 [Coprinellus aureogranulatus]